MPHCFATQDFDFSGTNSWRRGWICYRRRQRQQQRVKRGEGGEGRPGDICWDFQWFSTIHIFRDSSHDGGKEGHRTGIDSAEAVNIMWKILQTISQHNSYLKVINEELVAKITENANLRMKLGDIETTFEATVQVTTKLCFQKKFWWSLFYFQALRERCEELEKEKLELGCGVKARESEASRFVWNILSFIIPLLSVR